MDSIRGVGSFLESNNNAAADTSAAPLDSFDSDGVTLTDYSNVNSDTNTFVAWNWKAGGAPTADNSGGQNPTSGSVMIDGSASTASLAAADIYPTKMSINTTSGFSIVKYTGTSSAATYPHGLSQAPELVINKDLDATGGWPVLNPATTSAAWIMELQDSAAQYEDSGIWNSLDATPTLVNIGNNSKINYTGREYISYCFHSVEGYSKVGSYEGNNNADGTFVYTGFRPAWVLIKQIGGTNDWFMTDDKRVGYNPVGQNWLLANTNAAETTSNDKPYDYLSNGFKFRDSSGYFNDSGSYLYIAFAKSPFKYSNAR